MGAFKQSFQTKHDGFMAHLAKMEK